MSGSASFNHFSRLGNLALMPLIFQVAIFMVGPIFLLIKKPCLILVVLPSGAVNKDKGAGLVD